MISIAAGELRSKRIEALFLRAKAWECFSALQGHRNRTWRFIMNWDQIAGNWKQITGKVKEKWGKLTDDELTVIDGKQEQLVGRVQERYGIAKDEAERQVKSWADRL